MNISFIGGALWYEGQALWVGVGLGVGVTDCMLAGGGSSVGRGRLVFFRRIDGFGGLWFVFFGVGLFWVYWLFCIFVMELIV